MLFSKRTLAKMEEYSVRSGSTFKDRNGQLHNITVIIIHEKFDMNNNDYDVAVFKVDPPFERSNITKSIDLPGREYVDDEIGFVAGWGYYMVSSYSLNS